VNYCTSCLRELNGVVSCPGCGASVDSMPRAQDSPSVVSIRRAPSGGQNPLPTLANHGAEATAPAGTTAADRSRAKARARAHAAPSSMLFGGNTSAEPEFIEDGDSAGGTRYGNRGRHSHRRRSLARRVTATGGFAGIAVVGSLALSSLSTPSRDSAAPTGSIAITSTLTQPGHSATVSSGTTPNTPAPTLSNNGSSTAAARNSTTISTPSTSQSSSSEKPNYTPRHAAQTATPAEASTGAQPSSSATQSTTAPSSAPSAATSSEPSSAPSSASPSPTQTNGICILVLCL